MDGVQDLKWMLQLLQTEPMHHVWPTIVTVAFIFADAVVKRSRRGNLGAAPLTHTLTNLLVCCCWDKHVGFRHGAGPVGSEADVVDVVDVD